MMIRKAAAIDQLQSQFREQLIERQVVANPQKCQHTPAPQLI